ncbi:MAG: alpha/beta hydrolase [Thermomicrobiales bacterium]
MSRPTTESTMRINDADLLVRDSGEGVPVVLVQPGLVSGAVYEGIARALSEKFRIVTFDTRGHGGSTNPSQILTFEQLADDTAALIRELNLDRPVVGGWSDGGEVAIQLGLRHPDLARALIAAGTSLQMGGHEPSRDKNRAFFHTDEHNQPDLEAFAAEQENGLLPFLSSLHTRSDTQWQDVVRWSADMWISYEGLTVSDMARIRVPTMVLVGDREEFIPVEEAVRFYQALPQAELAILPGSDHMRAVFEPDCVIPILIDFIERHC